MTRGSEIMKVTALAVALYLAALAVHGLAHAGEPNAASDAPGVVSPAPAPSPPALMLPCPAGSHREGVVCVSDVPSATRPRPGSGTRRVPSYRATVVGLDVAGILTVPMLIGVPI